MYLEQHQGRPEKIDTLADSVPGNGVDSMEKIAAPLPHDDTAEVEEVKALTTEDNKSKQAKEDNGTQEEEEEEVSNIDPSKDPSAIENAVNVNLLSSPSDLPSVLHVALPPKDVKEEEEKGDTTQQAEQLPVAQKKVVKSEITTAIVAVQSIIDMEGAIGKRTTHARPFATSVQTAMARCNSGSDNHDGEEKKMDDEDLSVAQLRFPPTTPDTKTNGVPATTKVVPSPLGQSSMSTPQSDTTKAKSMPTPYSTTCSSSGGNDGRALEEMMTTDDMANATMEQKVDGVSRICACILPFIVSQLESVYMYSSQLHNSLQCTHCFLFLPFHSTAQTPSQHHQESIRSRTD